MRGTAPIWATALLILGLLGAPLVSLSCTAMERFDQRTADIQLEQRELLADIEERYLAGEITAEEALEQSREIVDIAELELEEAFALAKEEIPAELEDVARRGGRLTFRLIDILLGGGLIGVLGAGTGIVADRRRTRLKIERGS